MMEAASSFDRSSTQNPIEAVRDALNGSDRRRVSRFRHMQFLTLTPDNFRLLFEDNELRKLESSVLFLLAIRNDDDNTNTSVVSIFNDWIYDANMSHAVPYNYDFMQHVMSSLVPDPSNRNKYVTTPGNFTGILMGYAIYECRKRDEKNYMKSAGSSRVIRGRIEKPELDLSVEKANERTRKNYEMQQRRKNRKRSRSTGNRPGQRRRHQQQGEGGRQDDKRERQPQRQQQQEQRGRKRQRDESEPDNDE